MATYNVFGPYNDIEKITFVLKNVEKVFNKTCSDLQVISKNDGIYVYIKNIDFAKNFDYVMNIIKSYELYNMIVKYNINKQ